MILGDQNSDPVDGDSVAGSIQQLLDLDGCRTRRRRARRRRGGTAQGGANATHQGDPALDTADFTDDAPGNIRADYVLPSHGFEIVDAGVFWPPSAIRCRASPASSRSRAPTIAMCGWTCGCGSA